MCCVATHMHNEKRRETGELVRYTKYLIKFLDCAAVLFSSYKCECKLRRFKATIDGVEVALKKSLYTYT